MALIETVTCTCPMFTPRSLTIALKITNKKLQTKIKQDCQTINKDLIDECISDLRTLVTIKFKNNKVFEVPQDESPAEKIAESPQKETKVKVEPKVKDQISTPQDILDVISSINSRLPDLDQMRWLLKEQIHIKTARDGMSSLSNSFNRLAIFLQSVTVQEPQPKQLVSPKREDSKKFEDDFDSPDTAKQKSKELHLHADGHEIDDGKLLEDHGIRESDNDFQREIIKREDDDNDGGEEDEEESMSLKDVIMTLNDFYSEKLEGLLTLLEKGDSQKDEQFEQEVQKIEKIVKDNEVRIPYDEDIFIGIDKNYKILKKSLIQIKDKVLFKVRATENLDPDNEKDMEIKYLRTELEKYKSKYSEPKVEKEDDSYSNFLEDLKKDNDGNNSDIMKEIEEPKEIIEHSDGLIDKFK